jgi:diguanylate cyclase (GGDEF)-like protein/PAS domain S-box-containing protein
MHPTEDDTTDPSPAPPRPQDVLRDVLALRRKVSIAVYGVITLDLPLYLLFGYTIMEIAILAMVGWVIAGAAIWFSFTQIMRQRRRSAYPGILIVSLGDTGDPREAASEALFILEGLLSTQSSFIALRYETGLRVISSRGISNDEAQWVMETHARQLAEALDKRFPIPVLTDAQGRGAIFVPIVSLKQSIGVLYAASPSEHLADLSLLADIGSALGLSLENLRQKEQLQQKESRLRSVVMGAPVVLFAVDTAGAMTFIQGQGIAGLNVDPDNIIGRPVWDIWQNRPEIIQSFRRAFAGDSVTSLAELDIGGVSRVFEYRLAPERDEHDLVTGVICIATDVTQRKNAEDALRESERAKATLLSNLPGFAYRTRESDWAVEYVSDGILEVTGYSPSQFMSGAIAVEEIILPEDRKGMRVTIQEAVDRREAYAVEYRIITKSGETKWVWEQGQAVVSDDSDVVLAMEGYISDITERRRAEDALAESEMRYRDLFENARDAMYSYNLRGGSLIDVNDRVVELTGFTREELLSLTISQLVGPDWHQVGAEALKAVFAGGDTAPHELEIVAKDGRRVPLEVSSRILMDENGLPITVQAIGRDITERKQAEETIKRLAYHDALTDLPNRALFEDRLNLALAQARRMGEMLAVMFLDLDSFKVVNDTLGHGAGDKLLQAVASDIAKLVRDGDTVARVGGDEFTLLLAGIAGPEDATDVAQRILDSLRQPRTINGTEFRTTGSIGITMFPADGDDGEALLRNADTAMYRAKERGRDNYQLYTASMNAKMMERIAVEQDLRHALQRKELVLFYQPIISVETGQVTGAEALLRWNHPQRGIVTPDEFIPLAEETGLIVEIGESVLRDACLQLIEWRKEGLPIEVMAVNLSARQLQQENLVQRVAQILSEAGISPDRVQLEITEGAVMKNVDHAISMLRQLGQMGIEIALDDFGTGYSSLTYLKRFPIDAVKIDRSFVRDLEHDASDATIVSTVIAMADNLHLNVIAEGVETEAQLEFLRARGCREYQGYLFSRPVPADEFSKVVRASMDDAEKRVPEVA